MYYVRKPVRYVIISFHLCVRDREKVDDKHTYSQHSIAMTERFEKKRKSKKPNENENGNCARLGEGGCVYMLFYDLISFN